MLSGADKVHSEKAYVTRCGPVEFGSARSPLERRRPPPPRPRDERSRLLSARRGRHRSPRVVETNAAKRSVHRPVRFRSPCPGNREGPNSVLEPRRFCPLSRRAGRATWGRSRSHQPCDPRRARTPVAHTSKARRHLTLAPETARARAGPDRRHPRFLEHAVDFVGGSLLRGVRLHRPPQGVSPSGVDHSSRRRRRDEVTVSEAIPSRRLGDEASLAEAADPAAGAPPHPPRPVAALVTA